MKQLTRLVEFVCPVVTEKRLSDIIDFGRSPKVVRESFENVILCPPPAFVYDEGRIPFSVVVVPPEERMSPAEVHDIIKHHRHRSATFGELVWAIAHMKDEEKLQTLVDRLTAMGTRFRGVISGMGWRYAFIVESDFFSPKIGLVSDENISSMGSPLLFLTVPIWVPAPIAKTATWEVVAI